MIAKYVTTSSDETIELGKQLAGHLKGGDSVLLYGELGAGKTHFTKGIAEGLGITMTIKSPTFALVNRFPIGAPIGAPMGANQFYHYDLFRLEEGSDLTSVGFEETIIDPRAINVVEWADRLGSNVPSQTVVVRFEGQNQERTIKIEFNRYSVLPETEIENHYAEWVTPIHVRNHCKQVSRVAQQMAEAYMRMGKIINTKLLYVSCMLHDMCRLCDFRTLERDRFEEEVTDEKWEKWKGLREQFKGIHHADIASDQLKDRGFYETAECIRLHKFVSVVEESSALDTLEKKITYYADKRVKHTEIVDLEERFRDGRKRHGAGKTVAEKEFLKSVEKAAFELERELFEPLDIEIR